MTRADPPDPEVNNATYSSADATDDFPATSFSPKPRVGASTNPSSSLTSRNVLLSADGAKPASEAALSFEQHDLDPPIVTINGTNTPDTAWEITAGSANAPFRANHDLELASFGGEPWTSAYSPYLNFARRPAYEPTGQLLHEQIESFDRFDSPVDSRSFADTVSNQTLRTAPDLPSFSISTAEAHKPVNVFVQPSLPRSALKRKAESIESPVREDQILRNLNNQGGRPPQARSVSFEERMSGPSPNSPEEGSDNAAHRRTRHSSTSTPRTAPPAIGQNAGRSNRGTRQPGSHPPSILPPEKVFPIQIGSELFRLSGASISSDAPSYFTQFFEEQIRQNEESGGVRTLYIDRDPVTFRDVARHLQGYHIKPRDGSHFVKLFADAQFYSLPRLINQLFESEIFIQIGEKNFQIPKDIFSEPGNSPNFFSLGFAVFFSTPGEVFPGLDRRGLLRPPSITPPYVPGRSAEIFAELLHLLRGYPLHIRNDEHRADLLRDCRYFHLRGLEQKVIAHEISYNLERQKTEICIRLEDVKPSGVSFTPDEIQAVKGSPGGWVFYARPFVDDTSYELVVEIGGESTLLDLDDMRADFHNLTKARVSSLFQVVANKMNLPTNAPLGLMMLSGSQSSESASPGHTPLSEDRVRIRFEPATDITLDGESLEIDWESPIGKLMQHGPPPAPSESESESEPRSEGTNSKGATQKPGPASTAQQKRSKARQTTAASTSSPAAARSSTLAVPPIQTSRLSSAAPSAKKRKRTTGDGNEEDKMGEWVIQKAQWRLRVQPNPQDTIRGGFEIVFVATKVLAYSTEHARNAQRGFLGGG